MADITRLLSLQGEVQRDPTSELARILASSAPYNNGTDSIGASMMPQPMNQLLSQGMALMPQGGNAGIGQPQQQQQPMQGALPYGWGTGTTGY